MAYHDEEQGHPTAKFAGSANEKKKIMDNASEVRRGKMKGD